MAVADDRQERGTGKRSALREPEAEFPCFAIATIDELIAALLETGAVETSSVEAHSVEAESSAGRLDEELLERIRAYRAIYGGR